MIVAVLHRPRPLWQHGDDALVLAETLGTMATLKLSKRAFEGVREAGASLAEERAGA
jgi:hypothetical protein